MNFVVQLVFHARLCLDIHQIRTKTAHRGPKSPKTPVKPRAEPYTPLVISNSISILFGGHKSGFDTLNGASTRTPRILTMLFVKNRPRYLLLLLWSHAECVILFLRTLFPCKHTEEDAVRAAVKRLNLTGDGLGPSGKRKAGSPNLPCAPARALLLLSVQSQYPGISNLRRRTLHHRLMNRRGENTPRFSSKPASRPAGKQHPALLHPKPASVRVLPSTLSIEC